MKLKQYKRVNLKHTICPILGCTQRIMNYKGDEEVSISKSLFYNH
jgi:hypothetical protein